MADEGVVFLNPSFTEDVIIVTHSANEGAMIVDNSNSDDEAVMEPIVCNRLQLNDPTEEQLLDDSEKNLQEIAYEQQQRHFLDAYVQAELMMMELKQPFELSSEQAELYYKLVKNKIGESRYQWQEFQEIMYMMQGQDEIGSDPMSILSRISRLFNGHPDLLEGFGTFLPPILKFILNVLCEELANETVDCIESAEANKREQQNYTVEGKIETCRTEHLDDPSVSHVGRYGTLKQLSFFEKVKKALGYYEVYQNFMRFLQLYQDRVITKNELVKSLSLFLCNFPDLMKEFKDIIGFNGADASTEYLTQSQLNRELEPELAMDIDYCTSKRMNASYRALPKNFNHPKCSGQTSLCREVLNDVWVSFPSWSEESPVVTSCKTQYEEMMYRVEDERFELDMAIQTNAYAIKILDEAQKKINKMSDNEKFSFTMDESLGSTSLVLCRKFIRRIYGDRIDEVMEGLKKNPVVAVPIVLNRLRVREHDWKDIQKKFNAVWKEQINNYYIKSLDHKGINFRQADGKRLRPKTLLNEIETRYEEKKQQITENSVMGEPGPHLKFNFNELHIFSDAISFISLMASKQPGIYKDDKNGMENLISYFLYDFFNVQRNVLPSEGKKKKKQNEEVDSDSSKEDKHDNSDEKKKVHVNSKRASDKEYKAVLAKLPYKSLGTGLQYCIFFVNTQWYIFFRLFYALCDRLAKLFQHGVEQDEEMANHGCSSSRDTSVSSYNNILAKIKRLLTGKLDSSTFEEKARELYGIHAYVSYTMDKVVHTVVKQLHQINTDETSSSCISLYANCVRAINAFGSTCPWKICEIESEYLKKVKKLIGEDNCYKVIWDKVNQCLTIELLDPEKGITDEPCIVEKWSDYLDDFLDPNHVSNTEIPSEQLPVVLPRNLKKQKRLWKKRMEKMLSSSKGGSRSKFLNYMSNVVLKRSKAALLQLQKKMKIDVGQFDSSSKSTHDGKQLDLTGVAHCSDKHAQFETSHDSIPCTEQAECTLFGGTHSLPNDVYENVVCISDYSATSNDDVVVVVASETGAEFAENINCTTPDILALPIATQVTVTSDGTQEKICDKSSDVVMEMTQCNDSELEPCNTFNETSALSKTSLQYSEDYIDASGLSEFDDDNVIYYDMNANQEVAENLELENSDVSFEINNEDSIAVSATHLMPYLDENRMDVCEFQTVAEPSEIQRSVPKFVKITRGRYKSSEEEFGAKPVAEACNIPCEISSKAQLRQASSKFFLHSIENRSKLLQCEQSQSSNLKQHELVVDQVYVLNKNAPKLRKGKIPKQCSVIHEESGVKKISCLCNKMKLSVSDEPAYSKSIMDKKFPVRVRDNELNNSEESVSSFEKTPETECLQYALKGLIVQECAHCRFDGNSYKMRFVANFGDFIYRPGTLLKARQAHQKSSRILNQKFYTWHRSWLDLYVTPNMMKSCNDWLLRSDPDKFRVDCVTVNEKKKPPYSPYSFTHK